MSASGETNMTIAAKWLGACKADQKPGDIIMASGEDEYPRHAEPAGNAEEEVSAVAVVHDLNRDEDLGSKCRVETRWCRELARCYVSRHSDLCLTLCQLTLCLTSSSRTASTSFSSVPRIAPRSASQDIPRGP